jgi:hypothetical protein
MIIDVIVFSSIVFAIVFFTAWILTPRLRAWIERPKYRFQANVQSYDKKQTAGLDSAEGRSV